MDENSGDAVRLHLRVTGRVQNVGFRAFVQQAGSLLGLTGWVRNVGYSQVETVAEGTRPVLEKFAGVVKEGPRGSRVEQASEEWEKATGEFNAFTIRSSR
jgi:acylphosphatase